MRNRNAGQKCGTEMRDRNAGQKCGTEMRDRKVKQNATAHGPEVEPDKVPSVQRNSDSVKQC